MNPLRRLASMDRAELSFRLHCEVRKAAARVQWAVAPPRWNRADLSRILTPATRFDSTALVEAGAAAQSGDAPAAHRALAAHFASQPSAFPFQARAAGRVADRIRTRFPAAPADSAARAARILEGRYDVLGYQGLAFGRPPRWHYDPVHERVAPGGFWSRVPYLDPAGGDHKVIWEVNRHQHWLALGRAYHLTGDRRCYDEFVLQLEDWMTANPPLSGVNWASMLELGFRALSWTWALQLFAGAAAGEPQVSSASGAAPPWIVDLLIGLDRQLTHVEHNLSRYFSPNTHLTGEALALYVCGAALPELAASPRRVALGRTVLLEEIARQIRPDGGHAELSAHYHRYSTDFYLMAVQTARAIHDSDARRFEEAALRQALYLRALADSRGRLPLIGDDDGGQLLPLCGREPVDCRDTLASAAVILDRPELAVDELPEETFWLCGSTSTLAPRIAADPDWPSTALPSSGYYISRTGRGDHLIFDAGPHGFRNGGHAHSDALSVVLTVEGVPLLVDPGTATYTMDPAARDLFRSTAMHNTVVMNGRPQSEPDGPFHWRSSAQAHASVWRAAPGVDYVEGRHDGYAPRVHARGVLAVHGLGWFVLDHFLGAGDASAEAFWHLHPDWSVVGSFKGWTALQHTSGRFHDLAASADIRVLSGRDGEPLARVAPAYGRIEPAACLVCHTSGELPRSVLTFIPALEKPDHAIAVERLHVDLPPPPAWHAVAYRVHFGETSALLMAAIERTGIAAAPTASPGSVWGTREAQTDGRAALLVERNGTPAEGAIVNGTRFETDADRLSFDPDVHLARFQLHPATPQA